MHLAHQRPQPPQQPLRLRSGSTCTCSCTTCSSSCSPAPAPAAPAPAPAAPRHQSSPEVRERLGAVGQISQAISSEVQKVIIGKAHVIDNVMINILSNGNLLFEDYPGLAKTLMTNTFADALGCDFKRVQFTLTFYLQISQVQTSMMLRKENLRSSQDLFSVIYCFLTRLTVLLQRHKPLF